MLTIKGLTLTLSGKDILSGIDAEIEEGISAFVGPNGAGKSSLGATIMGLSGYTDIKGDILFEGRSIKHLRLDERARLGITLAWQEPARYEGLKVYDFLAVGGRAYDDVSKALQTVGLSDYYMERAVDKTLSGGERKKIELASILLMKPRLVILDEPDSGIDIASIEKIFQVMRILRDSGSSVILITHSPEILSQSEHAFLMCNGRIIERGNSKEISSNFRQKCMPCDHQNIAGDGYRWN